jgi:hypothetical protein
MKFGFVFIIAFILMIWQAQAVKVGPVKFDVSVSPGTSKEFSLNVIGSKGFYTQDINIYASDFSMQRTGALSFGIFSSTHSAVPWINVAQKEIILFEDQSMVVNFTVAVPYDAKPGEYYAVILLDPKDFTEVRSKSQPVLLQMKTRVAVVVILEVPGRVYEKKGEAIDLAVSHTDSLLAITSSFNNLGDIHLDVKGEAIVRSADGRFNFGSFTLQAPGSSGERAFIFPKSIRDFRGVLDKKLPTGDYMLEVYFDYGYEFRKATASIKFSIQRDVPANEDDAEFLSLKENSFKFIIPSGGRRTQVVSLSNTDYRPLNVSIPTYEGVSASPNKISLKPGETRNIILSISVKNYEDDKKEKDFVVNFETDRGKDVSLNVYATEIGENLN